MSIKIQRANGNDSYTYLPPDYAVNSTSSQNANYANSCGNADTLDGYHANQFLTENSIIPASFLNTYCAKIGTEDFSFSDTQQGGTGWFTFTYGYLCKLISVHGEVGESNLQREFKRIGIINSKNVPYTISDSVGDLLLISQNNYDDDNIISAFKQVSDGENFFAKVSQNLGGCFIKRSATVTSYSGTTIGFFEQYWYKRQIVTTYTGINFLTQKEDFLYGEQVYISNNQKILRKGQLGSLVLAEL